MITPILETQRLILRPFHREDARAVLDTWESDPDVARYMFWTSHNDIRKTEAWLDFELSRIEKPDWYRFAIELKASYSLIGTALMYAALRLLYSRIGQPYVGTASYFSFNDPNGMCPECSGIGKVMTIDIEGRIDPEKTWNEGMADLPAFHIGNWYWKQYAESGLFPLDKKWKDFTETERNRLLYGADTPDGPRLSKKVDGVSHYLHRMLIHRDISRLKEASVVKWQGTALMKCVLWNLPSWYRY